MDWPQWIHWLKWSCRVWTQSSGRIEPLRSYVKGWGWQWGWRSFTWLVDSSLFQQRSSGSKEAAPCLPLLLPGPRAFVLWAVASVGLHRLFFFLLLHFVYNVLHCEELQNTLCLLFLSVFLHSDKTIMPSSENPQSLLHEFQFFSFKHNDFFFL